MNIVSNAKRRGKTLIETVVPSAIQHFSHSISSHFQGDTKKIAKGNLRASSFELVQSAGPVARTTQREGMGLLRCKMKI